MSNQTEQADQTDQAEQIDPSTASETKTTPGDPDPGIDTDPNLAPRADSDQPPGESGSEPSQSGQAPDPERRQAADRTEIEVFRYDPAVEAKAQPRYDTFAVPDREGMTVLDALIYARDTYDSSLTFRYSCRQAACGSDAMLINGAPRLGCRTQLAALTPPVRVEPLAYQAVIKDLVVDMEQFYDQMDAVEPYFDPDETPDKRLSEQHQSPANRETIKLLTRCVWCGACLSSCAVAGCDDRYLGPAAVNAAYRFIMDDREGESRAAERLERLSREDGVWRCQTQFSCTDVCPKEIPLTDQLQTLKRKGVIQQLPFW